MPKSGRTDLQIRGVPQDLIEKLRTRAEKQGTTMSQYAIDLLTQAVSRAELEEWLVRVRRHPIPVRPGISAAQAVREAREERAEHLANVVSGRLRRNDHRPEA